MIKDWYLYKSLSQLSKSWSSLKQRKLELKLCANDWILAHKDFIKFLLIYLLLLLDLAVLVPTFTPTTLLLSILLMILLLLTYTRSIDKGSTPMILSIEISKAAI